MKRFRPRPGMAFLSRREHGKLQNGRSQGQNTQQQICNLLITTTVKTSVFLRFPLKEININIPVIAFSQTFTKTGNVFKILK